MTCKRCEDYRKQFPLTEIDGELIHVLEDDGMSKITSSPIECAFENSNEFSTDNWCCETMRILRQVVMETAIWHNDSNIGVLPIPVNNEGQEVMQGMLVMSWYKNRGRTGRAMVFWDDNEPLVLNLETANYIIKQLEKK